MNAALSEDMDMATEKIGEIHRHTPDNNNSIGAAIGAIIGGVFILVCIFGVIGAIFG